MKKLICISILILLTNISIGQNVGILRKNYTSSVYDSINNFSYEVLDSSTIRLGAIDPLTGTISHLNSSEYTSAINLNGATIDPYQNHYYIGSGFNLLTFDISSGDLINNVPISGPLVSASFQNYRFNQSDSTIYGMVPVNYYSMYFDSLSMSYIEELDSSRIRFGSIDPQTGNYSLIGNTSYNNIYTLAGNSIDPFQMVYYYSAVDTLIGIDLYTGMPYSVVPIQLPQYGIFENIAYSCADTSIYGITRQNYTSLVYDSLFMDFVEVFDSTTFKLSKIDPNTGVVTFISPSNLQAGGNLTGGAFIDPNTMTYFFNNGNQIVGVSLISGLITSSVTKTYPSGEIAFDMMRSTQNCFGAIKLRENTSLAINENSINETSIDLFPNPVLNELNIVSKESMKSVTIIDITGHELFISLEQKVNVSLLPSGIYFVKITTVDGEHITRRFVKE